MSKVIVYELNEVSCQLINRYISARPNSAIANIVSTGAMLKTINNDVGHLSPWITWPTLHRGVNNTHHHLTDLGEDLSFINKKYPTYMEILQRSGVRVGVFNSLQTGECPDVGRGYDFFVPDPFTKNPDCIPSELTVFQKFNLRMTKENGKNVNTKFSLFEAASVGFILIGLGVRVKTVLAIIKQLCSEFVLPVRKTRRRTVQSMISFDLFNKLLQQKKPDFVSYFTNNAASSMHRYWPATFPEDYKDFKMPADWVKSYKGEIWNAMDVVDEHISKLNKFANKYGYALFIVSSMGQAAVENSEVLKSQLLLVDRDKLFNFLDITGGWVEHLAMSPRYVFEFYNDSDCDKLNHFVNCAKINSDSMKSIRLSRNRIQIELGHPNLSNSQVIHYMDKVFSIDEVGMNNIVIQDMAGCYAYHINEGVLISNKKPINCNDEIQVSSVAPTILNFFQVDIPEYMDKSSIIKFES